MSFRDNPSVKIGSLPKGAGRATRLPANINIEVKPAGRMYICDFPTINVSKTGLLLGECHQGVPYQEDSYVELAIDTGVLSLPRPIKAIGKITRIQKLGKNTSPRYGVQIVQISDGDQKLWNSYLDQLEGGGFKRVN